MNNDDIYPVTPRITDPDLRPRESTNHYASNSRDSSLIEFDDVDTMRDQVTTARGGKPQQPPSKSDDSRGGFNILGFNLTYKHIIIIVLVIIALLIVIYLVVNWLRKPSPGENLCQTPPPGNRNQVRGNGGNSSNTNNTNAANAAPGMGGNQPQQAPRPPTEAARSAAELAALMQQTQNKLNELKDAETADTGDEPSIQQAEDVEENTQATQAPTLNTHMDVPQEQIDNILSNGEDDE
ncbi:hypothetical protein E24_00412 [Faustovirus]|nr:hypothetical protein PRJ_Fausto_00388 [Faustovirus]AMN83327.1 hypothetical protein E24_00412 [Faustovirus]AMN84311.1 hypothetical protein D5a_00411 [Faustovirus]AMN85297.1 hypothetical protein E23_00412 [Faustovirus]QBR99293.1 hypothetical protein [Faustovirus mariensis]